MSLVLKGDVASYSSSGASDNTSHVFKIATSASDTVMDTIGEVVVALGNTSNVVATTTLTSVTGNSQRVLRSKLTVSGTAQGTTSGRTKGSVDDLALINFTADSAGAVKLQSLIVTIGGSAASGTDFFITSGAAIKLYDPSTNTSYNPVAASSPTVSFDLLNYSLSAGATKSFTLRLNSNAPYTKAAVTGVAQSLSASIDAATDVYFTTADNGGTTDIGVPAAAVPISISSVNYAAGT